MQSLPHVAESQHAVTGREDFGCAMQDLVLSVISLIIFNYHSTIISWFSMFRCLLHLTIVEFLHRGMQAHLTWGPGLVALVSQLQFTPCRCRHQAATACNVNFRARGNFNVVPWAEMTTRWHCLLAMLAMHWWLLTWTSKHFSSVFSAPTQSPFAAWPASRKFTKQCNFDFCPCKLLHLGSPSKSMPLFSLGSKQWLAPYSPEALDKNHQASSSQWQNGISWTSWVP